MISLFNGGSTTTTSAETKAAAYGWLKLYDGLNLMTNILTPIILVIALGLITWALVGRMYGKTVDGERQKMAKNQFIGIVITGIVLITLGTILVTVMKTSILKAGSGILSTDWSGYTTYETLKTAATA